MYKEEALGSKIAKILTVMLIIFSIYAQVATAQLAEIAGQLYFNVQVGHSQTLQWRLINEGNQSLSVQIVPPYALQLTSNSLTANQPLPLVYYNPTNATISPRGSIAINVTVSMPLNDTPNFASWEGIVSAQEGTNQSNTGGALIIAGVAKGFSISAIPSTTTTSTTTILTTVPSGSFGSSNSSLAYIGIGIVVLVILGGVYYATRPKKSGKKSSGKARASAKSERIDRQIEKLKMQKAKLAKGSRSTKARSKRTKSSSKKKVARKGTRRRRR